MTGRGTFLAGALSLLLLVAGCGGGGKTESTGSLTKAAFLKKANAICAKNSKEVARLDQQAWNRYDPGRRDPTPSDTTLDKVALALLPVKEKELRLIRALGAPKGSEGYVAKMLAAWEDGIEKGKEDPSSLRGAGPEFAFYKTYSMGIDYGLDECWLG